MRIKLKQFVGKRIIIEAKFEKYGGKKGVNFEDTTMLLTGIYLVGEFNGSQYDNPIYISDHIWIDQTARVAKKAVYKGDRVRFLAVVESYLKIGEEHTETDYRFKTVRAFRSI